MPHLSHTIRLVSGKGDPDREEDHDSGPDRAAHRPDRLRHHLGRHHQPRRLECHRERDPLCRLRRRRLGQRQGQLSRHSQPRPDRLRRRRYRRRLRRRREEGGVQPLDWTLHHRHVEGNPPSRDLFHGRVLPGLSKGRDRPRAPTGWRPLRLRHPRSEPVRVHQDRGGQGRPLQGRW